MHIATISTLFPNALSPRLGIFVQRQCEALVRHHQLRLSVINPLGVAPWPLSSLAPWKDTAMLTGEDKGDGYDVYRPAFTLIPRYGAPFNPAAVARAALPLLRDLHEQHPIDLLDAQFFWPDGPAVMRLAKALDMPFSIKARGADIHYWGARAHCAPQIMQAAREADGLLAVTGSLKQDMADLGMEADKITVHYTGCDQQLFHPHASAHLREQIGMQPGQILLFSAGALIPRKRHILAINALTHLPDAHLAIAGSGPQQAHYLETAQLLGLEQRVHLLGNIDHQQMADWMAEADIMVLVSSSEGLANAWVEALASGTPVIASDIGGARDLFDGQENGDRAGKIITCHPRPSDQMSVQDIARDARAIAGAVTEIAQNMPDAQLVRSVAARFSWQRNADSLYDYYQHLIRN